MPAFSKDTISGLPADSYFVPIAFRIREKADLSRHTHVSHERLQQGLSNMGLSTDGMQEVFKKLSLPNAGLTNIDFIQKYPHIQELEIPGNNLTDVQVLRHLKYLYSVDLSNNNLTQILNFHPVPGNLQEVDLSRNQISVIGDLSVHRFLRRLCLDYNLIKRIDGLIDCKYLTHLSLVGNGISKIEGLDRMPLRLLDLRRNRIREIENIGSLTQLEELRLSHNEIVSISNLCQHPNLSTIDLESNFIVDLTSIQVLQSNIPQLRNLNLQSNPMCQEKNYRLAVVFLLPQLTILDCLPVSPEEKVAATNQFNAPDSVVKALTHNADVQKETKEYAVTVLPQCSLNIRRLRPLILIGPSSSKPGMLAVKLLAEFPHIFGKAISHTSRKARPGEQNRMDYYFVNEQEIDELMAQKKFLQVIMRGGQKYATSYESIMKVMAQGKVCIMDLEIEETMCLKQLGLEPRFIFIVSSQSLPQKRIQYQVNQVPPEDNDESPLALQRRWTEDSSQRVYDQIEFGKTRDVGKFNKTDALHSGAAVKDGMYRDIFIEYLRHTNPNRLDEAEIGEVEEVFYNDSFGTCYEALKNSVLKKYWDDYMKQEEMID